MLIHLPPSPPLIIFIHSLPLLSLIIFIHLSLTIPIVLIILIHCLPLYALLILILLPRSSFYSSFLLALFPQHFSSSSCPSQNYSSLLVSFPFPLLLPFVECFGSQAGVVSADRDAQMTGGGQENLQKPSREGRHERGRNPLYITTHSTLRSQSANRQLLPQDRT